MSMRPEQPNVNPKIMTRPACGKDRIHFVRTNELSACLNNDPPFIGSQGLKALPENVNSVIIDEQCAPHLRSPSRDTLAEYVFRTLQALHEHVGVKLLSKAACLIPLRARPEAEIEHDGNRCSRKLGLRECRFRPQQGSSGA